MESLDFGTLRNSPLLPIQQLCIFLRVMATGSFQLVVGDTVRFPRDKDENAFVKSATYLRIDGIKAHETLHTLNVEKSVKNKRVGFCAEGASNMQGLLRTFEALGERQLLPTRIGGTRWLPNYIRAITILLKTYKVLRYHLENSSHKNAKAEGSARLVHDGHRLINNLQNLYLQQAQISLAEAYTRVESTKITLTWLMSKEGSSVSAVLETGTFSGETLVFRGQKSSTDLLQTTVQDILTSLDSRFPRVDLSHSFVIFQKLATFE
ncbi:hypothetical protein DPMN_143641 [Dreissena polymorpha]|uniref:Uncharacterized protein n=1 Tax=Dreissena polymorpha TaxID=45954 RepID=A0A9D4JK78_DREPO|nr:hypothetical protein DPMN_143641 [Dreissena polymorpha]